MASFPFLFFFAPGVGEFGGDVGVDFIFVVVGAVEASALAAKAALEMIGFCENNISFGVEIVI
jgi:hypothetical protein